MTITGLMGGMTLHFVRGGAGATPDKPGTTDPAPGAEEKPKMEDLSRPPQGAPKGVTKFEPKFKSKTKAWKDDQGKYEATFPETWTAMGAGENDSVKYLALNPDPSQTTVQAAVTYYMVPVPTSDLDKGFQDRVRDSQAKIDQLFPGFTRDKTEILDAPNGLICRMTYSGQLTNAYGTNDVVVLCAITQRKMWYAAVNVVTTKARAGEFDDDALAALDSIAVHVKDRDTDAEKAIVGQWVVPSKTGNSFEYYQFNADGTYVWHHEWSYTGETTHTDGGYTAFGVAGQGDEQGRYEIRDDIIFFESKSGEQGALYRTWNENGKVYLKVGKTTFRR